MISPLKIVLVGAGFMGREHIKAAQGLESVQYVAVVDPAIHAARALGSDHALPAFADLEAAVAATMPDAVDICTPTPSHLPIIETCGKLGRHVLCEKPLALTIGDARRIRDIADAAGIRVMAAQVIRFWPEYQFAQTQVETQAYGRLLAVDCKRLSAPPGWNSWMLDEGTSGGAVLDLLIHDMDFAAQLLGRPRMIWALGRRDRGGWNAVAVQLIYPARLPVCLEASFLQPASYPFRMFFKIECQRATLEMDLWRPKGQRLRIFPADGEAFFPELESRDAYRDEIDYFGQAVLAGQPFDRVPLDDSIASVELCLTARRSCERGEPMWLRNLKP